MNYKVIDRETYYRKGVFRHFTEDCKCSTSITSRIDVTELVTHSKNTGTKFYEGQFGDLALDFGEYDYDLFIRAFNRLWETHGDSYMEVFNKAIFQDTALEMSLKYFQDDRFDAFISSEKFLNIVSEHNTANEFLSDEAYLAKMMKTQFLHYLIDRYGVLLKMPGPERMFDYTAQSLHLTSEMAEVLGLTVQEDGHTEENDANDVAERK